MQRTEKEWLALIEEAVSALAVCQPISPQFEKQIQDTYRKLARIVVDQGIPGGAQRNG